jgi:hypothetical protein
VAGVRKVDIKTIGFFPWSACRTTFKFLWAPLLDRYLPPIPWGAAAAGS